MTWTAKQMLLPMLASTLALLAHAAVPMSFDALPAGPLQDAQCNMETVDAAKYALAASREFFCKTCVLTFFLLHAPAARSSCTRCSPTYPRRPFFA